MAKNNLVKDQPEPVKKTDSEIVAAYKAKHEAEKAELAGIDALITRAKNDRIKAEEDYKRLYKGLYLTEQALLIRKQQLIEQVAKDAENIGDE